MKIGRALKAFRFWLLLLVARPFGHLMMRIESFYEMKFRRLSTRVHELVKNLSSARDYMHRPGSEIHGGGIGVSGFRKLLRMEGDGEYLVSDGVCLSLS